MKRQKYIHDKDNSVMNTVKFCAECGDDLTNFGMPGEELDPLKIQENHKNCKEKGKFKGDICSKMFIADLSEPISLKNEDE
jgi:hypothetical protein